MMAHPNGDIYVTDGYRDARVHRFTRDGTLVTSWGAPGKGGGQFPLPHSIAFDDDGKLYVADRANKRVQIFSPDGDFLGQWTGMGGPNDIPRGRDGNFYIAEQEDGDKPAQICVRDGQGTELARMASRHVHGIGVDWGGDIYAGLTQDRGAANVSDCPTGRRLDPLCGRRFPVAVGYRDAGTAQARFRPDRAVLEAK